MFNRVKSLFSFGTTSKKRLLLKLITVLILAYGFKKVAVWLSGWFRSFKLLKKAQKKQFEKMSNTIKEIELLIRNNASKFPDADLMSKIIQADVTELIDMLNKGKTTSVQLLLVFLHRCASIGIRLNAITEFNYTEAWVIAEECDRRRFETSDLPCLYGIPVSVKNNYIMRATDSSMGMISKYGNNDEEDGLLMQVIKEQFGAIPFVKTNVPTGIIGSECINYVYGPALSSYSPHRTPGGSSSGEAALISSGCSPLGFGTDAAGSIRTPCLFSGIYGFMITPNRVTIKGINNFAKGGHDHVKVYIGPMAKSVRDCALVVQNLVSNEFMYSNDFYLEHSVWNRKLTDKSKFTIAVFPESDLFEMTDPQKRVMKMTISKLSENGHSIVAWDYPNSFKAIELFVRIANQLMSVFVKEFEDDFLGGEAQMMRTFETTPGWMKVLGSYLGKRYLKSERLRKMLEMVERQTVEEFMKNFEVLQVLIDEIHRYFDQHQIDAILMPGLSVAYKHGSAQLLGSTHFGHIFPNAARLCAGTVPVDTMKPNEDVFSDKFEDYITSAIRENLKDGVGLPLGVQICAPKNRDEVCLKVMAEIENCFKFRKLNIE